MGLIIGDEGYGETSVVAVKLGSETVNKIYCGSNLVWNTGGGSGGGSGLGQLTDISRASGGSYPIEGSSNDGLGWEKLLFNDDGTELFTAYDVGFLNIAASSQTWTPAVWHESSTNTWSELTKMQRILGVSPAWVNIQQRCWFPRSISIASEASIFAGSFINSATGKVTVFFGKDASGDYGTCLTKTVDTGVSPAASSYAVSFPSEEEQIYNTALSPDGTKLAVNIPFKNFNQNPPNPVRDILRVYDVSVYQGVITMTQVGSDIEVAQINSDADTNRLPGTRDLKINNAGDVVTFTCGEYGKNRVHRWEYVTPSSGTASWQSKAISDVVHEQVSISGDCNRFAGITIIPNTDNEVKVYEYEASTGTFDEIDEIQKPSGVEQWAEDVSLDFDGNTLAISTSQVDDPNDGSGNKNTGAVVIFKESGTGAYEQHTDPYFGDIDEARMGRVHLSGDGSRVAVASENSLGGQSTPGRVYVLSVPS